MPSVFLNIIGAKSWRSCLELMSCTKPRRSECADNNGFATLNGRAAGGNHVEIMNYLMEKGAPVDQTDKSGRTALHWAVISGHKEATDILLAKVQPSLLTIPVSAPSFQYCLLDFLGVFYFVKTSLVFLLLARRLTCPQAPA